MTESGASKSLGGAKTGKTKEGHGIAVYCFGQTVRVYLVQTVRFKTMKDTAAAQETFFLKLTGSQSVLLLGERES